MWNFDHFRLFSITRILRALAWCRDLEWWNTILHLRYPREMESLKFLSYRYELGIFLVNKLLQLSYLPSVYQSYVFY